MTWGSTFVLSWIMFAELLSGNEPDSFLLFLDRARRVLQRQKPKPMAWMIANEHIGSSHIIAACPVAQTSHSVNDLTCVNRVINHIVIALSVRFMIFLMWKLRNRGIGR